MRAKLGAAFQRTVDTATDEELSNSPRDTANASLSVPVFTPKLYATAEAVYVGARGTAWKSWLSPYTRADLTLFSAGVLPGLELTFKVKNLFDIEYYDPSAGGTQFDYVQDRRNCYAKAAYSF
jgi:outer membrane receptor protein involved in Fe transport